MILLGLVAAMVVGVRAGMSALEKWQKKQAAEAKAYQMRMEERTFTPPQPCPADSLNFSLTHSSPLIYVGAGHQMELQIQNSGKAACTVVISPKKLGVEVMSGNQVIYNSTICQGDKPPTKQLLLDTGMSWKQNLNWDGTVQNIDCSPSGQIARAGTYRFKALWDNAPIGEESVIVLQNPPPPPSAENENENPTKTTG